MHNDIAVELIDCFKYSQKNGVHHNGERDFCAIAYRCDTACKYTYSGKAFSVSPESVVFVPSGLAYSTSTKKGEILAIHFNILNYSYREIEVLSREHSPAVYELFRQAINIWESKKQGYQYKTMSIFYEILSQLPLIGSYDKNTELAAGAAEYISAHFSDAQLSISKLAAKMYVSDAYLRKKFREYYGVSPKEYLNQRRIDFAKYLVGTDCFSQSEIAERSGFSSVKYFRTAFKKATGKSISEYKKQRNY